MILNPAAATFQLPTTLVPGVLPSYTWSSQGGILLTTDFPDDRYFVESRATDNAGNMETSYSTITFLVDSTPPSTTITSPANNNAYSLTQPLTNITGTSNDPNQFPSGVAQVMLSITQLNGGATNYFNGVDFSGTTAYMLLATSTAPWSYFATGLSAGSGNLIDGASYVINAHAIDVAGNVDVVTATTTFVYDTETPISTVTFPADGSVQPNLTDIAGTASDVGPAGIQKVQISLRLDNAPTSQTPGSEDFYFDPSSYSIVNTSSFTSTSEVWIDASGTTNWSYATAGIWKSGKRYWAKARAIDRDGNVQTNISIGNGNNFIVSLPASAFQVIVDTTTSPITAGTSRNITVNAVDNGTPPILPSRSPAPFNSRLMAVQDRKLPAADCPTITRLPQAMPELTSSPADSSL